MKTVLLFRSSFCRSNLLEYEGVFAYAKAHGWRIQTVEYMSAATNRYRLEGANPDRNRRQPMRLCVSGRLWPCLQALHRDVPAEMEEAAAVRFPI